MTDYRSRLAARLAQPDKRDWYRISAKRGKPAARIDLYDEIGFWGIPASDFVGELNELEVETIDLHINSPGGDAWDGIAIFNALKDHGAKIVITVDGVAASAASFIAMAGDEVIMNRHSEMMIHEAAGFCIGNASDMKDIADRLDKISDNIAAIYADRAGGSVAEWRESMRAETWYSDEEAVEAGLADKVVEKTKDKAKNSVDLSMFNYAGREEAPTPRIRPRQQIDAGENAVINSIDDEKTRGFTKNDDIRTDTFVANSQGDGVDPDQLKILGLPEDATKEDVDARLAQLAALEAEPEGETKSNENDEVTQTGVGGPPTETATTIVPEPSTPTTTETGEVTNKVAATVPEGFVVVDKSVWDETRSGAAYALQLREENRIRERDAAIENAVREGKIAPSRKAYFANLWDADEEGAREVLGKLKAGVAVPLNELGHADGITNEADVATEYSSDFFPHLRVQQGAAQ